MRMCAAQAERFSILDQYVCLAGDGGPAWEEIATYSGASNTPSVPPCCFYCAASFFYSACADTSRWSLQTLLWKQMVGLGFVVPPLLRRTSVLSSALPHVLFASPFIIHTRDTIVGLVSHPSLHAHLEELLFFAADGDRLSGNFGR